MVFRGAVRTTAIVLLRSMLIGWTAFGMWNGLKGTGELYALSAHGRFVNAQVIGVEPLPAAARTGYVHYAFNDGSKAIDSRFAVARSDFAAFPIGATIPITYLPSSPHVVRMGEVTVARVAATAGASLAFIAAGAIAFGLAMFLVKSLGVKSPAA